MNWFVGSIQDAVATSKRKKAFFIVYVEGTDEMSEVMSKILGSAVISKRFDTNNFVSIKLAKGSEGHKQFEEIYKLVPVPSIFFIDQNGSPTEIVVSDVLEENIIKKLNNAIDKCLPSSKFDESLPGPSSATSEELSSSASAVTKEESAAKSPETVASGSSLNQRSSPVRRPSSPARKSSSPVRRPSSPARKSSSPVRKSSSPVRRNESPARNGSPARNRSPARNDSPAGSRSPARSDSPNRNALRTSPIEDRVERAKLLLEKKKEEKKEEEIKSAKSAEMERRMAGQKLQEAKRIQQDRELMQLKEERDRAKKEEAQARQRILDQIKQDRAERAQRLSMTSSQPTNGEPTLGNRAAAAASRGAIASSVNSNTSRLQFKLPNGETQSHSFPAETTLLQVREFVDNNIELPFGEYQMATTFPRREFTARDHNLNLRNLQLVPSAVILILPVHGSITMRTGWAQMLIDMMWDLVTPVISLSRYISNLIFRRRGNTSGTSNDTTSGVGNINRLTSSTASARPSAAAAADGMPQSADRMQRPGARANVRKRGNIYSLRDNQDDNDENNTWNGNSTQQM